MKHISRAHCPLDVDLEMAIAHIGNPLSDRENLLFRKENNFKLVPFKIHPVVSIFSLICKKYILFSAIYNNDSSERFKISLKKACPTRWSSKNDALSTVRKNYSLVMKTLYQLNSIA